ncbi:Bacteriophage replication protein O [Neisseria subflava]|uniref:Bacteriophage replication protein O n=2 Tax=Neisseria subflava TaxID=28449 RepID=A0A9X9SNH6_NEISU|nr:Bacteriophage replication protein O [Neisseria subflava]
MTIDRFIPNSFQIANAVIDEYLSKMSGNALKCYILIVRKTRGWQKTHDSLSISQIQKFTGIRKEETVQKAINELVELGLIGKQSRIGLPNEYFLISDPKKGVTPPPKNGVPPENGVPPKKGVTPPPKMGVGPPPKKGGHINTKYKKQISTNVDINTEHEKTVKKPTKHEADLSLLAEHGITGQIAEDFLTIRKAKRQPLTETAMRLIASEAQKVGMTAFQAVVFSIGNGWGSFRADWVRNKTFGKQSGGNGGLTHNMTADVLDGKEYGDQPTTDF